MFLVTFYQFGKKENSTKRPTETQQDIFTTYQCLLKDSCSVLNPVLWLNVEGLPTTWNPTKWTYAFIADFDRYYFVTDWQWEKPHWEAHLTVDPLASYRTQILASSKYVLRSASDYDPEIIDTLYSPTGKSSTVATTYDMSQQNWSWDPSGGSYVFGIVGDSTYAINGVTYYKLSQSNLRNLIYYMYRNVLSMNWDSLDDWNAVISKAFIDPADYIVSAHWFPWPISGSLYYSDLKFGFWNTNITNVPVIALDTKVTWNVTLGNPPDNYYNYGAWELLPPFANYAFQMMPFGTIPLNALRVRNSGGVKASLSVDCITGLGMVDLKGINDDCTIASKSTMFGIPIPIGRQRDNILSMIGDTIGAVAGLASGTGGIAGAAAILTGASVKFVGDLLSTNMQASGTTGSYLGDGTIMKLIATYIQPQPENNAEFGRALCRTRLLNTLSGYCMCADGEIDIVGMYDDERKSIEKYLTSGFYIE